MAIKFVKNVIAEYKNHPVEEITISMVRDNFLTVEKNYLTIVSMIGGKPVNLDSLARAISHELGVTVSVSTYTGVHEPVGSVIKKSIWAIIKEKLFK